MIKIGFSRPKNKLFPIFSWLIRLVERTSYSHVYIKIYSSDGTYFIYQASGTHVNIIGSKYFEQGATVVKEYSLPISSEQKKNLLKFVAKECGAPYSITQILNIACHMLFGKGFLSSKGYVCSEIAAIVLRDIYNFKLEKDENILTPKDIDMLLARVETEKIWITD